MKCVSLLIFSSISVDSSNIFVDHSQTALFDAYESHRRSINSFLLGDSGYMLRDWLLIPVANHQTRQEQNYNFSHSSTRTAVERSIGVAKRRWQVLVMLSSPAPCLSAEGLSDHRCVSDVAQLRSATRLACTRP